MEDRLPTYKDALTLEFGSSEFPVEMGKIREMSTALLDASPCYRSDAAAKAAGLPGMPVPITFPMCTALYQDSATHPIAKLMELGICARGYVVHGEQEFVYHRPIYAGEKFTVVAKVSDAYQKEGSRGGLMTFFVADAEGIGADGKPAFVSRMLIIERTSAIKKS